MFLCHKNSIFAACSEDTILIYLSYVKILVSPWLLSKHDWPNTRELPAQVHCVLCVSFISIYKIECYMAACGSWIQILSLSVESREANDLYDVCMYMYILYIIYIFI